VENIPYFADPIPAIDWHTPGPLLIVVPADRYEEAKGVLQAAEKAGELTRVRHSMRDNDDESTFFRGR
jgi:hypothetical protein